MSSSNQENKNLQNSQLMPMYVLQPKEEEVNLLHILRVMGRRKWSIFFVTLFFTLLAFSLAFFLPKKYSSQVSLLPIKEKSGGLMDGMADQLSAIPGIGDKIGEGGGSKNKQLLGILKSRHLSEKIIEQFDLMKVIFANQWDENKKEFHSAWLGLKPVPVMEDAVKKFKDKVVDVDLEKKTGLIKIEVTLKDPKLAAQVANAMVVELQNFIEEHALTVQKRKRIFLEQEFIKNQKEILQAGKDISEFYSKFNVSSSIPKINIPTEEAENLPSIEEILKQRLNNISGDESGEKIAKKQSTSSMTQIPGQVYLEYLALNKELLNRSHMLLNQQVRYARAEEKKDELGFQIIDEAIVPFRHSFPLYKVFLPIGLGAGLLISILFIFFQEYIRKVRGSELS
ncbi:MAG: hypothetical protein H7A32_05085 [Deltaproteobacteria bacterium]|nr:hypothetical protein [Deltaproteobacteria bacterium]